MGHHKPDDMTGFTSAATHMIGQTNEDRIRRLIDEHRATPCDDTVRALADEAITLARDMDRVTAAMESLAQPYRGQ